MLTFAERSTVLKCSHHSKRKLEGNAFASISGNRSLRRLMSHSRDVYTTMSGAAPVIWRYLVTPYSHKSTLDDLALGGAYQQRTPTCRAYVN